MSEGTRRGGRTRKRNTRASVLGALGGPERQVKKKRDVIMRTNQTTTERAVYPIKSPALGRTKTGRRGLSGRVRGKLLGGVVTALLALLLWPTAA